MGSFTPLDINSFSNEGESDNKLNILIGVLVLITLSILGFIAYLFFTKYQ